MSITLSTAARNASAAAVGALLNGGTIVFKDAGSAEVATVTFANPAFGSPSDGTITANPITPDNDVTGGTVAAFDAKDSLGNVVFSGTVSTAGGGGDFILTDLVYGAGGKLEVSSFTYTQPA